MSLTLKQKLQRVGPCLVLRTRPMKAGFWVSRGFSRLARKPNRLATYWERRICADPTILQLVEECWQEYLQGTPAVVQPPTFVEKVKSFTSAVTTFVQAGATTTPEGVLKTRLQLCAECPFWTAEAYAGLGRCEKCGCATQVKLRMPKTSCPIGKWGPV